MSACHNAAQNFHPPSRPGWQPWMWLKGRRYVEGCPGFEEAAYTAADRLGTDTVVADNVPTRLWHKRHFPRFELQEGSHVRTDGV